MNSKALSICSLALSACVLSCSEKSDVISEKIILKAINTTLEDNAAIEHFEMLNVGSYECNDEKERLILRELNAAGLLDYQVDRLAWWEKGQKNVRESYKVTKYDGWWPYSDTEYRTVKKTQYNFEDHYYVNIGLTKVGKALVQDNIPTPKTDDKDMQQPDFSEMEYAWDNVDLSEVWPEIQNPFIEQKPSSDRNNTQKEEGTTKAKTSSSSSEADATVRIDSLQYQAYVNKVENCEEVYLKAYRTRAVKARNIQIIELGGTKRATAEAIIETDNVSDVGRIISEKENGMKELVRVNLVFYIDKGWVVDSFESE